MTQQATMMTTPPMVVAMGSGYFGLKLGEGLLNGVSLGSLVPHMSYGIALGLLLERYVRSRGHLPGLIWQLLRSGSRETPSHQAPPQHRFLGLTARGKGNNP